MDETRHPTIREMQDHLLGRYLPNLSEQSQAEIDAAWALYLEDKAAGSDFDARLRSAALASMLLQDAHRELL